MVRENGSMLDLLEVGPSPPFLRTKSQLGLLDCVSLVLVSTAHQLLYSHVRRTPVNAVDLEEPSFTTCPGRTPRGPGTYLTYQNWSLLCMTKTRPPDGVIGFRQITIEFRGDLWTVCATKMLLAFSLAAVGEFGRRPRTILRLGLPSMDRGTSLTAR